MNAMNESSVAACLKTAEKLGNRFGYEALLAARNEWIAVLSRHHAIRHAVMALAIVAMQVAVLVKLSVAATAIPMAGALAMLGTGVALLVVRRLYLKSHPQLALQSVSADLQADAESALATSPWLKKHIESPAALTYLDVAFINDRVHSPAISMLSA